MRPLLLVSALIAATAPLSAGGSGPFPPPFDKSGKREVARVRGNPHQHEVEFHASPDGRYFALSAVYLRNDPALEKEITNTKHLAGTDYTGLWRFYLASNIPRIMGYTLASPVRFCGEGEHFAFVGARWSKGKDIVVIDGEEKGEYLHAGLPVFSRDDCRPAFYAWDAGRYTLFRNDERIRSDFPIYDLALSADGRHVAYVTKDGRGAYVINMDGKEVRSYYGPPPSRLAWSAAGQFVSFLARRREGKSELGYFVYANASQEHRWALAGPEDFQPPVFSEDGMRGILLSRAQHSWLDFGKEGFREYGCDQGSHAAFSSDGDHSMTICGTDDGWRVFHDDRGYSILSGPPLQAALSEDGQVIALAETVSWGRRVAVHKFASGSVSRIAAWNLPERTEPAGLYLTSDGRHVVYKTRDGESERQRLHADGRPLEEFDAVSGPIFSPGETRLAYYALQGYRVHLVTEDLE